MGDPILTLNVMSKINNSDTGTVKKELNNHFQSKSNIEPYGKVVLTLKNCLLPEEKLFPTPSQIDGLDADTETDLRILGCELMQTAGILLKLPQVAMATAQVLFQRFYYSKSFVRQNYEITGMGCLYLASKIEEAPRRIRDVINVYHHIKQVNNQKTITPMILDQNYISLKYQVIKAERRVLKELGFCVHIKHPHKLIVLYLQVLGLETKHTLMQLSWNYMNDSLRTDVFVRYQPETVACACIYLTARRLKMSMPKSPPWFSIFKVEEKDILDICVRILRLYSRPKPKVDVLEKKVQELCKKFEENRQKNKPVVSNVTSGTNTPTSPIVVEKKASPKRSHSDHSKSKSKSPSDSPKPKKSKKHKKSTSRSRSRSRSHEKKYKKSHKNSRHSRSTSPPSKSHKEKKHRSRSRSHEREHPKKSSNSDWKYYSDRYKEEKGIDRYFRDEKFRSKEDDKFRKEKGSGKEDEKHSKKSDENYRKEDHYKNSNSVKKEKKSR